MWIHISRLRLYPEPTSAMHCSNAVADNEGLETSENVFVGNGSDEVLSFVFFGFFDGNLRTAASFPEFTYSFYPVYSGFYNIPL